MRRGSATGPPCSISGADAGPSVPSRLAAGRPSTVSIPSPTRLRGRSKQCHRADFRLGMMESLPWADASFDVVTGFNAVQYALDPDLALLEAARVLRPGGRIAVCKWGPPASNEFFAFLAAFGAGGVRGDRLPPSIRSRTRSGAVVSRFSLTGDVPAPIEIAGDAALEASLSRAGIAADPLAAPAATSIAAAAAPYRQADGTYRFDNRLRYWVLTGGR